VGNQTCKNILKKTFFTSISAQYEELKKKTHPLGLCLVVSKVKNWGVDQIKAMSIQTQRKSYLKTTGHSLTERDFNVRQMLGCLRNRS
jgi:hypothetical protein